MLEVINSTIGDYRVGPRVGASVNAKLVLEATETPTAELAIRSYNRDRSAHRPHYVLDPVEQKIYRTLSSEFSALGEFHPTAPHRISRCVFVAIVKEAGGTLGAKAIENVGKLLRVLCDIEDIPAIVHECEPGEKMGHTGLQRFEGILCWHLFPGNPEAITPGNIDWTELNKGLQDYATPEQVGIVGDGDVVVYEAEEDVAVEVPTEDLSSFKVSELKEIASELGISHSGLKKAELVDAITKARE
jgi:hypothetical protein